MIVQLEEKIVCAKDVAESSRAFPSFLELIGLDRHVDLALETGAHTDKSFGMFAQQLLVDSGLVMHPFEMRRCHKPNEILVTGLVSREQGEMIRCIAHRV